MGLLEAAGVDGADFRGGLPALLEAGAVADGRIVGTAQTAAITARYTDIGVSTDERWRGRGIATAAAAIVARRVQETSRTPVWRCGEDNMASLRVARKLGFEEVSPLTYVIIRAQRLLARRRIRTAGARAVGRRGPDYLPSMWDSRAILANRPFSAWR